MEVRDLHCCLELAFTFWNLRILAVSCLSTSGVRCIFLSQKKEKAVSSLKCFLAVGMTTLPLGACVLVTKEANSCHIPSKFPFRFVFS